MVGVETRLVLEFQPRPQGRGNSFDFFAIRGSKTGCLLTKEVVELILQDAWIARKSAQFVPTLGSGITESRNSRGFSPISDGQ